MPKILYLAGPMSGYPSYNFGAFTDACANLRRDGYVVVSPHEADWEAGWVKIERSGEIVSTPEFDIETKRGQARAIVPRTAITTLAKADAVIFLPGWEDSKGCWLERRLAIDLGLPLYRYLNDGVPGYRVEPELIVGFAGLAGAGKDTACGTLHLLGWETTAFADRMRTMLEKINPWLDSWSCRLTTALEKSGWDNLKRNTPEVRQLLQRLGTEAGRDVLGPDIWVDQVIKRTTAVQLGISDVRFPNEVAAIHQRHGIVIRVIRPGLEKIPGNHASEQYVDELATDYDVINNGTPLELQKKVATKVATWLSERML